MPVTVPQVSCTFCISVVVLIAAILSFFVWCAPTRPLPQLREASGHRGASHQVPHVSLVDQQVHGTARGRGCDRGMKISEGVCPAHIRPSGLREIVPGHSGSADRLAGRLTRLQWQNAIFRDIHAPGAVHRGFSESHAYRGRVHSTANAFFQLSAPTLGACTPALGL